MQAIWSDYGDVRVQLYGEEDEEYDWGDVNKNWETIVPLHDNQAGPGAWLPRWKDVPSYDDSDADVTVSNQHVRPLTVETFQYDHVQWVDSMYNSPYKSWPQPETPPEVWSFYKIPPRCHAYLQIADDKSPLFEYFKDTTSWRIDKPMFVMSKDVKNSKRYPNNSVIIMLEVAWARQSKKQNGESAGLVDWRYECLHFLTPPYDFPIELDSQYDLISYGQSLGTLCPSKAPSNDHFIQWINMHIYNTGALTLYCPGISVWVTS